MSIFGRVLRVRMITLSCVIPCVTRTPGDFATHCRDSHELPGWPRLLMEAAGEALDVAVDVGVVADIRKWY